MRLRALIALGTAGLLAGCAAHTGDKAGGAGGVTTLALATADPPGRPSSTLAQAFAAEVRRRSAGRLRIRIGYAANIEVVGANVPAFDQDLARLVRTGRYELGIVPARAWDAFGVRTLEPLQAPFLIDSDALLRAVTRDPV